MLRYHLHNRFHWIEFPHNSEGLNAARTFRKSHPEYKGRRIREVIQAYPSHYPNGIEFPLQTWRGEAKES